MKCEEIQERLSEYIEQTLNQEEKSAVEGHLSTCVRCRAESEILTQSIRTVSDLPPVEPPPGFSRKVMSRIHEEEKPNLWSRLFFPLEIKIPIQAVSLLLVCGFAVFLYQKTLQPQRAIMQETFRAELETPEEKDRSDRFEMEEDELVRPSPTDGRETHYAAGNDLDRNLGPEAGEELPASSPVVKKSKERAAKKIVAGALQQDGKVEVMEKTDTIQELDSSMVKESSDFADLQEERDAEMLDRIEGQRFRKEREAEIAAVAPSRVAESLHTADVELLFEPRNDPESLNEKLKELIRQAGGEYIHAHAESEEFGQANAPESEVLWLTIPVGEYDRFKTNLASLGSIEMESGNAGLKSGVGTDSYAPAPPSPLRIKLTIQQPDM